MHMVELYTVGIILCFVRVLDNSRKMILGESPGELTRETRVKFYPWSCTGDGRSCISVLERHHLVQERVGLVFLS